MTNPLTVVPPETNSSASESAAPPAAVEALATEAGVDLARCTHANLQDMVKVADAKATTLVALHTLVLGGGLAFLDKLQPLPAGLFFSASVVSLFCAVWVIRPRISSVALPEGSRGLLWITGIPQPAGLATYVDALASTTQHQLLTDLAFENTKIAHLLKTKFTWLGRAIYALVVSLALFAALLVLNLIKKGNS